MGFISIFLKLSLTRIIKPYKTVSSSNGPLEDKPAEIYIFAMRAWPLTFLGFIVLRLIAQWTESDTPNHDEGGISGLMWIAVSGVLFLSRVGCLGFTLVFPPNTSSIHCILTTQIIRLMMIFAKDAAPSSTTLGAINGLIELTQAIGITIAPVIIRSVQKCWARPDRNLLFYLARFSPFPSLTRCLVDTSGFLHRSFYPSWEQHWLPRFTNTDR